MRQPVSLGRAMLWPVWHIDTGLCAPDSNAVLCAQTYTHAVLCARRYANVNVRALRHTN